MEDEHSSVEVLVRRVQTGDPAALAALVRSLEKPLLALANRVLRDVPAAEDVVVEVLARLVPAIPGFEDPAKFQAYARRAVRNASVDLLRSRSYRDSRRALRDTEGLARQRPTDPGHPADRLASASDGPEDDLLRKERRTRVWEAVEALGEPSRRVIRMFYEEDQTYGEIATALSVSESTVKRQLGSARLLLAVRLRDLEREDDVA